LPKIRDQDATDTFKHTLNSNEDDRGGDRGTKMHDSLVSSFKGDKELALRKFIQAYLASIASVDELIGKVLDFVDKSSLKDNTIIVFTSDHGWGMGEKGYLYKNSLWQESTRVPLIIRAPGFSSVGTSCDVPVSLVDLYPTLLELCGLPNNTMKNSKGRPLDGHSLVPLLKEERTKKWTGPEAVLTALYKWAKHYTPSEQSYSLKSKKWRYIRYANGKEELYDVNKDPKEWNNLALESEYAASLKSLKNRLLNRISTTTQPAVPEKEIKKDAEYWKSKFFEKYPEADTDKNGKLSWKEHKIHRAKIKPKK
jgi:arylsulfatase A-like enzyme